MTEKDYKLISSHDLYASLKDQITAFGGVSSPFKWLNDFLEGGFEAGELILVSGPTGAGKSTLMTSLTHHFKKQDWTPLWFEYELTPKQFIQKFDPLDIPLFYIPKRMEKNHLDWIDERIRESVERKLGIKAIFIDHLHSLFNLTHIQNSSLEIGDMAAKIKSMAVKYEVPIVMQVHPKTFDRANTDDPHHDDIRDSGLIPQYADTILMIWRVPNNYTTDMKRRQAKNIGPNDNWARVRITKNRRSGKLGGFNIQKTGYYYHDLGQGNYEGYN